MFAVLVRVCRGNLLTIALFAAAFLPSVSSQDLQSGVHAAPPQEMRALLAKQVKDQHLAGMGAIVVRAESVAGVAVAGDRKRGGSTRKIDGTEFKALPQLGGMDLNSERGSLHGCFNTRQPIRRAPRPYSEAGVSIAAAMSERITGSIWETPVTAQVLEPLGRPLIWMKLWPVPPYLPPAAGMAMSLSDYGRFLQMKLNALRGTETKFLSVATATRLHASPMQDEYALGWGIFQIDGVRSSTHAGGGGSFYALVTLQPGRDVGVAVVASSAGERTRDASDTVLNALLARFTRVRQ